MVASIVAIEAPEFGLLPIAPLDGQSMGLWLERRESAAAEI
jgi:hypothetical protein